MNTYQEIVSSYPRPEDLAKAPPGEIERLIKPLGLPARAMIIQSLAQNVANNGIPDTLNGLQQLPGIGPYCAAAYLSFHRRRRAVIVDANVVRLICRLLNRQYDAETRRKKWLIDLADLITPARNVGEFNYALLDFTMEICTKRPKCKVCPIGPNLCITGRRILGESSGG